MSVFAMADLHLSLSSDKPMDIFGARWQDYINKIKKNWNAVVTCKDTVVVPGDISWSIDLKNAYLDLEFIEKLPGRKLLGKGNHDYWWGTISKNRTFVSDCGFKTIDFLFNNAYKIENYIICGTRGWYVDERLQAADMSAEYKKIVLREAARLKLSLDEAIKIKADGSEQILVFFHFPPVFNSFVCDELIDVLQAYNIKRCYFGHIHGIYGIPKTTHYRGIEFSIISADYLNFIPMIIAPFVN